MIEALIALTALSLMEIVLGIDNIVFISILTAKLPVEQQSAGRRWGLVLALGTRIALLSCVFWIAHLKTPVFLLSDWIPVDSLSFLFEETHALPHEASDDSVLAEEDGETRQTASTPDIGTQTPGLIGMHIPEAERERWDEFNGVSWRDLILLMGGFFLIFNSVKEIHQEVEHAPDMHAPDTPQQVRFGSTLVRIAIMDIVFSLDSVMTAVGMANRLWVMITAVTLAVGVMILFADQVGRFIDQNPTIKMLALNFLLLIGVMLVAEGIGTPISKGYIYFAMAFALFVEFLNTRMRKRKTTATTSP